MNISLKSRQGQPRTITGFAAVLANIFMIIAGPVSAQGTDGLLGVFPGFPQVDAQGAGQQCSFDSGSLTLTIMSTPSIYFSDANTLELINAGMLTLTATTDIDGNVQSGSLVINGSTTGGLGDPLLTGDVVMMGLEDSSPQIGATDRGDFRITPSGGSILSDPNYDGSDFVMTLTMINSTYSGTLASDWDCGDANPVVGSEDIQAPPPIEIDIKPGSDPNSVNPRSKGVIPVAILGSTDFDALQVIVSTVSFGPDGAAPAHDGHVEDVNGDGFPDMVLHFRTEDTGIECGDTEATLVGETNTGGLFAATDSIRTTGCNANNNKNDKVNNKNDTALAATIGTGSSGSGSSLGPLSLFLLLSLRLIGSRRQRYQDDSD
jgi:hypothetical protein